MQKAEDRWVLGKHGKEYDFYLICASFMSPILKHLKERIERPFNLGFRSASRLFVGILATFQFPLRVCKTRRVIVIKVIQSLRTRTAVPEKGMLSLNSFRPECNVIRRRIEYAPSIAGHLQFSDDYRLYKESMALRTFTIA